MKYKKLFLISAAIAVTIMTAALGICADWTELKNWTGHYAVKYPLNWVVDVDRVIYLIVPAVNPDEGYSALINLNSLGGISPERLSSLMPDELQKILEQSFAKLEPHYSRLGPLEEINFFDVKGKKAVCGVFDGSRDDDTRQKHKLYVILGEDRVYVVIYVAHEKYFDKYLSEGEEIIGSLREM